MRAGFPYLVQSLEMAQNNQSVINGAQQNLLPYRPAKSGMNHLVAYIPKLKQGVTQRLFDHLSLQ